jgi:hypothetical protein
MGKRRGVFIGKDGTEYTAELIMRKMSARGAYISHQTACRRLKKVINDPSREDELLHPLYGMRKKKSPGMPREKLTAEQRETMNQIKAVDDGRMSLNEFLRS